MSGSAEGVDLDLILEKVEDHPEIDVKTTHRNRVAQVEGSYYVSDIVSSLPGQPREYFVVLPQPDSNTGMIGRRHKTTGGGKITEYDEKVINTILEDDFGDVSDFDFEIVDDTVHVYCDKDSDIIDKFSMWCLDGLLIWNIEESDSSEYEFDVKITKSEGVDLWDMRFKSSYDRDDVTLSCPLCEGDVDIKSRDVSNSGRYKDEVFVCKNCSTPFPKDGSLKDRFEGYESQKQIDNELKQIFEKSTEFIGNKDSDEFTKFSRENKIGENEDMSCYELISREFGEDEYNSDDVVKLWLDLGEENPVLFYDLETGLELIHDKDDGDPCTFCGEESRYRYQIARHYEYNAFEDTAIICPECSSDLEATVKSIIRDSSERSELIARVV